MVFKVNHEISDNDDMPKYSGEGRYEHPPGKSQNWRNSAACFGITDPDIFFTPSKYSIALKFCKSCIVVDECRQFVDSIESGEDSHKVVGVFANETPEQRSKRRGNIRANRKKPVKFPIHEYSENRNKVPNCTPPEVGHELITGR